MASIKFDNIYLKDYFTLVGPLEANKNLKRYDVKINDYYYGEKTFEKAEIKMQRTVINGILKKNGLLKGGIDLIIGGDLLNQISATNYAIEEFKIPFLGLYAACATFPESLIIGSMFLTNKNFKNIITVTSSHNLGAEKQFRYPIEYGCPKPHTATFTATGAVTTILSKETSKIKIESATIGRIVNLGIDDANQMGAVMAPAAADTLVSHLKELKRDINYYDLIITGDLGRVGVSIMKKYCELNYNLSLKNYIDAGSELYTESEETYSGGSGPACLPLILFNKVLNSKKYKKILIIGTGSLHSTTLINQKVPIPAIAHAVSLEVR